MADSVDPHLSARGTDERPRATDPLDRLRERVRSLLDQGYVQHLPSCPLAYWLSGKKSRLEWNTLTERMEVVGYDPVICDCQRDQLVAALCETPDEEPNESTA